MYLLVLGPCCYTLMLFRSTIHVAGCKAVHRCHSALRHQEWLHAVHSQVVLRSAFSMQQDYCSQVLLVQGSWWLWSSGLQPGVPLPHGPMSPGRTPPPPNAGRGSSGPNKTFPPPFGPRQPHGPCVSSTQALFRVH